jgi:mRNA-degrading endonuclease RelE of RelBE toxin-antitoxin system
MEFIEAPLFTKYIYDYLNEEEYMAMQWYLSLHPDSGAMISGSGGLRKIRWKAKGQGKSGGIRTIYYHKSTENQIWLLTVYGKNEVESIPAYLLKKIKEEIIK